MGEMAEQRQKSDKIWKDMVLDLGIVNLIQNEWILKKYRW
jgi:hypothetical protein